MSQVTYQASFSGDNRDDSAPESTSPGGPDVVRWQVVARTAGLIPAQIMAGRLQAEGIPARAWQEAAGQAIGLTVGLLGTGYVAVPVELAEPAERILASDADSLEDFDDVP